MTEIQYQPSDAGKRCSDTIRLHIFLGNVGRWVAIRLSDGGSDGHAYDSKAEATRFQFHETQCAYVLVPRDDMPPHDADRFLQINRNLYDAGMRLSDPDAPIVVVPQIRRLT